jgi:hypothetical protein
MRKLDIKKDVSCCVLKSKNTEDLQQKKYNVERCKKLIYLKKENLKVSCAMKRYINKHNLDERDRELALSLIKSLRHCSSVSLFGLMNGSIRLITSFTCNHKMCNICNWNRQKSLRRKYWSWFEQNESINKIIKNTEYKYVTNSNLKKYLDNGYILSNSGIKYDLMHLVLTVPHNESHGWRGKPFYYSELIFVFNMIDRKSVV